MITETKYHCKFYSGRSCNAVTINNSKIVSHCILTVVIVIQVGATWGIGAKMIIIKEMLYAVRCLKSNEDMILALAGQFDFKHRTAHNISFI